VTALPLLQPPSGCLLTPEQFAEQLDRVRTLRASVRVLARERDTLSLVLGEVDAAVLDRFVETERRCCPLLAVDFDPGPRTLRLATAQPEGRDVLDAFSREFSA
jgi:hypothetical protein